MKYVALDLRTTTYDDHVIEFAAILYNDGFEKLDTFHSFVKPIIDSCKYPSGITALTTRDSPLLSTLLVQFTYWIGKHGLTDMLVPTFHPHCRIIIWSYNGLNALDTCLHRRNMVLPSIFGSVVDLRSLFLARYRASGILLVDSLHGALQHVRGVVVRPPDYEETVAKYDVENIGTMIKYISQNFGEKVFY